jgi:WD40 repeat protein
MPLAPVEFLSRAWNKTTGTSAWLELITQLYAQVQVLMVIVTRPSPFQMGRCFFTLEVQRRQRERVRLLLFSSNYLYLVSSGLRRVNIWDLQTQKQMWNFEVQHLPLILAFSSDGMSLVAATQGNYSISWCLQDSQYDEDSWP